MDQLPVSSNNVDAGDESQTLKSKEKRSRAPHKKTPEEFRKMIVDAIESGKCTRKTAAATFNLPYHTIVSIYKQFLDTGEVESKKRLVFKPKKLQEEHMKFLLDSMAENCNYNIKDLVSLLKNRFSMDISYAIVAKKIPAFHYTLKRINETSINNITEEIISENKEYCELFLKLNQSGRLLVYVDQAEFQVSMRRFPGRIPEGQTHQLIPPPSLRSRNKTVMISMTKTELLYYKTSDESVKRAHLLEYIQSLFILLAERNIVGAVLIMGTAAFNHFQAVKDVTQLAGHEVIFLPMCSKYFNPIESVFSQWTTLIRSKNPSIEKEVEELTDSFKGVIGTSQCKEFSKNVMENIINGISGKLKYAD